MFPFRKLLPLLLVALPLLSGCGGGGGSGPPDQAQSRSDLTGGELTPPTPDPEDVSVQTTRIPWAEGEERFGVLYRPDQYPGPLPVVVMIHGGCWSSAYGLDLQADLSEALARRGFAVWNIEFRRLGNGGEWPVIFRDVSRAADFLATIAADYNLDLERVSAMGHSSGGHLALWLAGRAVVGKDSPVYGPDPLPIRGVVGLGPITDLESPVCASSVPRLIDRDSLTGDELARRLANTSPLAMLPTGVASILVSGSDDGIAPPAITAVYVDAAVRAGDSSEHLVIDGADHFDLLDSDFMDMNLLADSLLRVQSRTRLR